MPSSKETESKRAKATDAEKDIKVITETEAREAVIRDCKPRTPEKEPTGRRRRRGVLGTYLM